MSTRNAIIGAGFGLAALVGLAWAAAPQRPASPVPSEAAAPPPGEAGQPPAGLPAQDEDAARAADPKQPPEAARPEVTIQIRLYPEDGHSSDRGDAVRVRLDVDRLRAYDLCLDDVMKAFVGCSSVRPGEHRVAPPPGVVFDTHLDRPDRYGNMILRASPEGEIVRLRDIAKVEFVPAESGAAPDRGRQ